MASEEGTVVVAREEARLLALGPLRDLEARTACLGSRRLLVLLAEREPHPRELRGIELREHVRLILLRVGGAMEQQPAAVLADARVVTGREPVAPRALREREQLGEAEGAVAANARVRRLAARVPAHEAGDDRLSELLAQVEGHVRQAEPVTRLTRRDHGLR